MARFKAMARLAAGALLTMAAAFGLFAVVFAATGEAPAALVLLPPAGGPSALPADVRVLKWGAGHAIVTSENADYVRRLYGRGALLVLPVRNAGCLALKQPVSAARER